MENVQSSLTFCVGCGRLVAGYRFYSREGQFVMKVVGNKDLQMMPPRERGKKEDAYTPEVLKMKYTTSKSFLEETKEVEGGQSEDALKAELKELRIELAAERAKKFRYEWEFQDETEEDRAFRYEFGRDRFENMKRDMAA